MTEFMVRIVNYTKCDENLKASIANGETSLVVGKGRISLSNLTLNLVLHVLKLKCNLLLASKLAKNINFIVTFFLLIVRFRTNL